MLSTLRSLARLEGRGDGRMRFTLKVDADHPAIKGVERDHTIARCAWCDESAKYSTREFYENAYGQRVVHFERACDSHIGYLTQEIPAPHAQVAQ
jgi:hypothetical protein